MLFFALSYLLTQTVSVLFTSFRIVFAEIIMITSIFTRSLGLFLLTRRLDKITCGVTIQIMSLRYTPIYLFHADVFLFRTNIFTVLFAVLILVMLSGAINYELEQNASLGSQTQSMGQVFANQLMFLPGFIPLLTGVYF